MGKNRQEDKKSAQAAAKRMFAIRSRSLICCMLVALHAGGGT